MSPLNVVYHEPFADYLKEKWLLPQHNFPGHGKILWRLEEVCFNMILSREIPKGFDIQYIKVKLGNKKQWNSNMF